MILAPHAHSCLVLGLLDFVRARSYVFRDDHLHDHQMSLKSAWARVAARGQLVALLLSLLVPSPPVEHVSMPPFSRGNSVLFCPTGAATLNSDVMILSS